MDEKYTARDIARMTTDELTELCWTAPERWEGLDVSTIFSDSALWVLALHEDPFLAACGQVALGPTELA